MAVANSLPIELKGFNERKRRLLGLKLTREGAEQQLDSRSKDLLDDVEKLIRELTSFRSFCHDSDVADVVMKMEVQLLDAFPEAQP